MFFLEGLLQTLPTPAEPDGGAAPNSALRALPAPERTSTGLGMRHHVATGKAGPTPGKRWRIRATRA